MSNLDIVKPENLVYQKSKVLTENVMHYCPGCGHGTAHRLVAEVIEEEEEARLPRVSEAQLDALEEGDTVIVS